MLQQALQKSEVGRDALDPELAQRAIGLARPRRRNPATANARSAWPAANRSSGWSCSRHSRTYRRARRAPTAARRRSASRPRASATPSAPIDSMLMRIWIAKPRGGGMSACAAPSSASDAPPASCSCSLTRSMPVTSSVTVCSTCSRGLASMKANAALVVAARRRRPETRRCRGCRSAPPRRVRTAAAVRRSRKRGGRSGTRRDLDELLIAPLDGAFALPQMAHAAGAVADDLHLDMARARHQLLDVNVAVAEGAARLGLASLDRPRRVRRVGAPRASRGRRRRRPP